MTPFRRTAALLGAATVACPAYAAVPSDACDGPAFQAVHQASAAHFDARAVWLNRQLAKWPGIAPEGRFRLYHSASGAISAQPGQKVIGATGFLAMKLHKDQLPATVAARFRHLGKGPVLSVRGADLARMPALHRQQLVLVQEAPDGTVRAASGLQVAGALDDLYARAAGIGDFGATVEKRRTTFKVWAPTAVQAAVCIYPDGAGKATSVMPMQADPATGAWRAQANADLAGHYYRYVVDVMVNGAGLVRNLVTDPYSISLATDSTRSYVANLGAASLKPKGWDGARAPDRVKAQTDMAVYELHVRDFSINDATVPPAQRGKYGAFGVSGSNGMRHLAALARAGITDVHLLPVYDIATIPERGCATPSPAGTADSEAQQALVKKTADTDCFNWGYDPWHYNAPEGSYASDAADGARRIVEFREMVQNLHKAGLRVGMDVVYNHTFSSGQHEKSVLDRIVPGYYHRLNADGAVERSTCCDNTATEHRMMGKLMTDSVLLWATQYKIDSFRFDLMGHQPRALMEALRQRLAKATGRKIQLIGEGWNFGEVADGARFVQASQLSLNGSGIGTFNDRARDAARGGGAGDAGIDLLARQGYINGLAGQRPQAELLHAADLIRAGLAGSVRSYRFRTADERLRTLDKIDYNGQPAGYASEPGEAVNYVENHDNQTLFDINVLKLPPDTSSADRARVQVLGMAIVAFSQGVAYFHAGIDTLRSKSLDRNSFDSGDWFNRLDWSYQDNYFGTGLPPQADNGKDWHLLKPLLANPAIKPLPEDIAFARDAFRDLLRIRASSTLFRMRSAADIRRRLAFFNTGARQEPTVIAARLDGRGHPGAGFDTVDYFINVDKEAHVVVDAQARGRKMRLHPVHQADGAADKRAASASFDMASGSFSIPPRTAVVFVEENARQQRP